MSKPKAKAYADKWFSLYIRARDKRCITCGSTENLQCSHVFPRSHLNTRWDVRNAHAQCAACHKYHTEQSEYPYLKKAGDLLGVWGMAELDRDYRTTSKLTAKQIKEMGDFFKEMFSNLEVVP